MIILFAINYQKLMFLFIHLQDFLSIKFLHLLNDVINYS